MLLQLDSDTSSMRQVAGLLLQMVSGAHDRMIPAVDSLLLSEVKHITKILAGTGNIFLNKCLDMVSHARREI